MHNFQHQSAAAAAAPAVATAVAAAVAISACECAHVQQRPSCGQHFHLLAAGSENHSSNKNTNTVTHTQQQNSNVAIQLQAAKCYLGRDDRENQPCTISIALRRLAHFCLRRRSSIPKSKLREQNRKKNVAITNEVPCYDTKLICVFLDRKCIQMHVYAYDANATHITKRTIFVSFVRFWSQTPDKCVQLHQ